MSQFIEYVAICCDENVVCHLKNPPDNPRNFDAAPRFALARRYKARVSFQSFAYDEAAALQCHLITRQDFTVIAIAASQFNELPFETLLNQIYSEFTCNKSRVNCAKYSKLPEFSKQIHEILQTFDKSHTLDHTLEERGAQLAGLKHQVREVEQIMQDNIQQVLARQDRLDEMTDRSQDLYENVGGGVSLESDTLC